jgi:hypothetical protein
MLFNINNSLYLHAQMEVQTFMDYLPQRKCYGQVEWRFPNLDQETRLDSMMLVILVIDLFIIPLMVDHHG